MNKITDRRIDLGELRFRYREAGDPESPPVVLLHQLGRDSRDWDVVADALADRFRTLALDQRGHGRSARSNTYSFELMRDDVESFADALGLERFSLVGHSMGGTVAFLFAESYPDRLNALVIEDTPPPRGAELPALPEEPTEPVPFDWQVARDIVAQLNHPDPDWWELLPTIRARTLIVGGGTTSPIPQDSLAEVARSIPGSVLETIEGAGHLVHEARPARYIELVRTFLEASEHHDP